MLCIAIHNKLKLLTNMRLSVLRYNSQSDFTDGLFFIDGKFQCFTLEDEGRKSKVKHETRIPDGLYEVKLRIEGGFHNRYLKKYGSNFHKGMLHIQDVPDFDYILIHTGNTDDHTSGCLLTGMFQNADDKGFLGESGKAYEKIYPPIRDALLKGERVIIDYKTIG